MIVILVFFVLRLAVIANAKNFLPGADISPVTKKELVQTSKFGAKLYQINSDASTYKESPFVLDFGEHTSAFEQGYDGGYLLGQYYVENFNNLMITLLGDNVLEPAFVKLISRFLDWQWNDYMKPHVPEYYQQELAGMTAGGIAAGVKDDVGAIASWGIVLANFPGTISNLKLVLQDELKTHLSTNSLPMTKDEVQNLIDALKPNWLGLTCSMFGTWGTRTVNGKLFTGRNLDWIKDSGISAYKVVSIYRPKDGFAHATFGWAGIWGAITGLSSQGVTVHEANLESDDITFQGFPWVLRLREIMAKATTIDQALELWSKTKNTVGFNHGVGSANDQRFVTLETMKSNTAVFHADDGREHDYIVNGEDIGQPRPETVYRTNHGYDSYTRAHYIEGVGAFNNSIFRYELFPQLFDTYQLGKQLIGAAEAINITYV